jgi:hypothetical protein
MVRVSKKKDILTSFVLSELYVDDEYPVDCIEILFHLKRNNSKLKELNSKVLQDVINHILGIIRVNIKPKMVDFATIGFQSSSASMDGGHLVSIRICLVGKRLKNLLNPICGKIDSELPPVIGGRLECNKKQLDKTSLQMELFPLNIDFGSFVLNTSKNALDKRFYTDELMKVILKEMIVLGDEDLNDPLFKITI